MVKVITSIILGVLE